MVNLNKKLIYLFSFIGTIVFFYTPFSRALEVVIVVLFFVEIPYCLCLKKNGRNWGFYVFFVHFLTLALLFYCAPQGGRNKKIDTSKWNGCTLEAILQDISNQTGFFISIEGIPITSKRITENSLLKKELTQRIYWNNQKLTVENAVDLLSEETIFYFMVKENKQKILWCSMSGHWTTFSIPIYKG